MMSNVGLSEPFSQLDKAFFKLNDTEMLIFGQEKRQYALNVAVRIYNTNSGRTRVIQNAGQVNQYINTAYMNSLQMREYSDGTFYVLGGKTMGPLTHNYLLRFTRETCLFEQVSYWKNI